MSTDNPQSAPESQPVPAAEPTPNRCEFCGRDCSFFATTDGCCLPCGDLLQANPLHCINNLVVGGRQLAGLAKQNAALRAALERITDQSERECKGITRWSAVIEQARKALGGTTTN